MSGVVSGQFGDDRPWWQVAVAGRPDLIECGLWAFNPARDPFDQPGAHDVRRYLDDVLWKKRRTHQLCVYYRGDDESGLRYVIEAYCATRKVARQPLFCECDLWGNTAGFRRDLLLVTKCAALIWFGPREQGPDPVTLAAWLGIPYRVVDVAPAQQWEPEEV